METSQQSEIVSLEKELAHLKSEQSFLPRRIASLAEFISLIEIKNAEISNIIVFLNKYLHNMVELDSKSNFP